ncbi:hypothetical protein [Acinetobacter shaoyimingii]|uniref:Uncharacterized protein n=1 Tax=Acinetobacter shaoyimingii TaxID=2715164 RepID=A0A6G8RVM4_9GAMM|nr:hypothetical protein [Acinetobacter shaoyimingii]NHB57417.1 hypothetical protein [Acinetobacter shaoyimingii]QIO05986.1 hypothetical protein G8E00_08495 [Acinetobacter shaoyimingii]
MSDTQQNQGHTRLLLNIVMVLLETFYSFILKHDRVVRLQAKKFIEKQITLKINSYIPYFDFYVQFSSKGILFDLNTPEKPVDMVINSTLIDLIQIFAFANRKSLKKMRIEADPTLRDEFKDLCLHLSMPKLISDWKQWLNSDSDENNLVASKKRIAPLLEKIDLQRSRINTLQVEVKQYQNRIRRMTQSQKRLKFAFGITLVLFLVLLMYNLWIFFQ